MTAEQLRERISTLASHILFDFAGKECGIDPINANLIDLWCGGDGYTYSSVDDAMRAPVFDGKCLEEIAGQIQITSG